LGRGALASEEGEESEAHEHLEFIHPLISNSPQPERLLRFDYGYFNEPRHHHEPGADRHTLRVAMEYAFVPTFSLELTAPYTFLNPDGESSVNHLDNLELIGKYASRAFQERGVLFGGGLTLELPTGSGSKGIGSNHIVLVEPFLYVGYQVDRLEIAGFANFGLPFNENDEDEPDLELSWNLSFLYRITDRFHGLVEFDGEHLFEGEEDGFDMVNINPGIQYRVFEDRNFLVGAAARLPLTDDKEFHAAALLSVFYAF
jgi:hypothetical protein